MNIRHLYLFFFLSTCVWAQDRQISNEGEAHILPETTVSLHSPIYNSNTARFINDGDLLVHSDIVNWGIWGFTPGLSGFVTLEAQSLQKLDGTMPTQFYDILFNNTTPEEAFRVEGDIEIHGDAYFHEGILNLRNTGGKLKFFENSYAIDANDYSYVDGFVEKAGGTSFDFPIGHGGYYRPLGTFGASATEDIYQASYHLENSNLYYPHSEKADHIVHINENEYWELIDISSDDDVYLSLSLHPDTTPEMFRNPDNNPTIVAWNKETKQWEDIEAALDEEGTSITTVFKLDVYGAYTLATVNEIEEIEDDEFFVYNGVNPKDTGGNEYFRIDGLDKYPENDVSIYNRWGVEVYHTKQYDTNNNVFRGISEGRATIRKNAELPEGTYFYVIRRMDPNTGKRLTNSGYLYLIR